MIIELPLMMNNCIPSIPQSDLAAVLAGYSDSFMDLIKTFVYFDTSANMIFN